MTEHHNVSLNRTPRIPRVLTIAASIALVSSCAMQQETRFPALDITSRVETEPKIVCTNCVCDPDGQCFCSTCTITADPPPSN